MVGFLLLLRKIYVESLKKICSLQILFVTLSRT